MKHKEEVSAGGIVYKKIDSKILWLITQHSQNKEWSLKKELMGEENKGEPMEEAALREVQEEGGVKAKIVNKEPVKISYKYRFEDYLIDKNVYYFLMEYISGDPKDHDWEVAEARFLPQDELLQTLSFKTDKEAFQTILDKFEKG